jgi:2,4-dienoyl-CoA reductase (NADPH2)
VTIHTSTKVSRFTRDAAFSRKNDRQVQIPVETMVIAVGVRSNRTLVEALEQNELEMYVIGDAVQPRKALEAIWEGFEVGLKM